MDPVMTNGYKIVKIDEFWRLKCGSRTLLGKYDSEQAAKDDALERAPCGEQPPKPKLVPKKEAAEKSDVPKKPTKLRKSTP